VEDVLEIRMMLEPLIARRAAENATSSQIRRLLAIAKAFEAIPILEDEANYEQLRMNWLASDRELHILLAEAAQNPILPILIEALVGQIWHSAELIKQSISKDHHDIVIQHHSEIAKCVAEKDADGAEQAMQRHLEYTRDYLPLLRKRLQDIYVSGQPKPDAHSDEPFMHRASP
jgi:DNA-binding FadR family transcriptional regulator